MKKIKALIVVCAVLVSMLSVIICYAARASSTDKIEKLKAKGTVELIGEIDKLDDSSIDSGEAALYSWAILDRVKAMSTTQVEKMICDSKHSKLFRVMLLQIANDLQMNLDYCSMSELVFDPQVEYDIKYNIIVNIGTLRKNPELLEKIYREGEEDISFQAMRMLFICDHDRWYSISEEILKSKEIAKEHCLKNAVLEMGDWIHSFGNRENAVHFIDTCDEILHDDKISRDIKECAFFSLCDLRCKEGLAYIVASDTFSKENKSYAVAENCEVLIDLLGNNISIDDLNLVLSSVEYYPMTELLNPLQAISKNLKETVLGLSNEEEEKEISATLEKAIIKIQTEGESVL